MKNCLAVKFLSGAILFLGLTGINHAKDRPNLLFIMMDDLGYGQCQFHNGALTVEAFDPYFKELVAQRQDYTPEQALEFSRRAMPTLNRLVEEGVVFSRAFAPSNLCAPSRIAIATGLNQQKRGIYTNVDVEQKGLEPGSHLAHRLQDNGYATAHIGKWHIARRDDRMLRDTLARHGVEETLSFGEIGKLYPEIYDELWDAGYYGSVIKEQNPLQTGFDYYYGYNNWASQFYDSTLVWENYEHAGRQAGYNTEVFTDKALDFIRQQVSEGKPFYVQLHYHAVHDYLQPNAPNRYFRRLSSYSYELTNFYAHVYAVDYNVQRILDYLEEKDALDKTLIVFTSDNGAMAGGPSVLPGNAPFSGHKGTYYQGGTRIPLVFNWPDGIRRSRVLDSLVSSMDILPTCLEAAGVEVPDGLDGKSLLPLLTGGTEKEVRKQMVWAGIHSRSWGFLINKSYKNHWTERPFAPPAWVVLEGDYLLRFIGEIEPQLYHEYPDGAQPRFELYNYIDDPAETTNLVDEKPELVEALKADYLKRTESFQPPVNWKYSKWEQIAGRALD
jgi:uncharacterized sulfatase